MINVLRSEILLRLGALLFIPVWGEASSDTCHRAYLNCPSSARLFRLLLVLVKSWDKETVKLVSTGFGLETVALTTTTEAVSLREQLGPDNNTSEEGGYKEEAELPSGAKRVMQFNLTGRLVG